MIIDVILLFMRTASHHHVSIFQPCVPEMLDYNVSVFQEIHEAIKGGKSVSTKLHWNGYVNISSAQSGLSGGSGGIIVSIYF